MTDDPVPDPSLPDSEGLDGEAASEEELNALLAAATSLADEVSEDIGAKEEQAGASQEAVAASGAGEHPSDIDARLADVETLLEETGKELGTVPTPDDGDEASSTDGGSASTPPSDVPDFMAEFTRPDDDAGTEPTSTDQPATPPADREVPDFMDEFTRPEPAKESDVPAGQEAVAKPTSGSDAATAPHSPAAARPGVVSSRNLEQTGALDATSDGLPDLDQAEVSSQFDELESASALPPATDNAWRDICRHLVALLSPMALRLSEHGVRVLEAADGPTQRLGAGARHVIGWVAIATIGTSLIVYVVSLF